MRQTENEEWCNYCVIIIDIQYCICNEHIYEHTFKNTFITKDGALLCALPCAPNDVVAPPLLAFARSAVGVCVNVFIKRCS